MVIMSTSAKELQHFPFKLYAMLEYAAASEHRHAVSWIEAGRGFAILDKAAFLEHVVPRFFKQTKYRSFTRQLNLWGFVRVHGVIGRVGAWRHAHFLRGRIERLGSIQRVELKNGKVRQRGRAAKSKGHKPVPSPDPVAVADGAVLPGKHVLVPRTRRLSASEVTTEFVSPLLLPARFQSRVPPPTPTALDAPFPPAQGPATVRGGSEAPLPLAACRATSVDPLLILSEIVESEAASFAPSDEVREDLVRLLQI